jgi:hypothetical protein
MVRDASVCRYASSLNGSKPTLQTRFKLHLLPKPHTASNLSQSIPPLPPNKSVVQVLADFLRYLYACASSYIQETHPNGAALWDQVQSQGGVEFVFSHPNGWEGFQRQQMREAAVMAGLVPDANAAQERAMFVSEGEASLHYAVYNGLPLGALQVRASTSK